MTKCYIPDEEPKMDNLSESVEMIINKRTTPPKVLYSVELAIFVNDDVYEK